MGVNYTADDYKPTLRSLLPRGKAWNFDLESNFLKLVFSFAVEMARVSNRALELITQVDPRTTTELLSDWERVLGLPDTCQGVLPASIEERRQDVISRLTMVGGQSLSYFKSLAQKRGFNVEFIDGYISRSGQLRSGQRVQARSDWAFTIRMDVDEGSGVQYFQAGVLYEAVPTSGTKTLTFDSATSVGAELDKAEERAKKKGL